MSACRRVGCDRQCSKLSSGYELEQLNRNNKLVLIMMVDQECGAVRTSCEPGE